MTKEQEGYLMKRINSLEVSKYDQGLGINDIKSDLIRVTDKVNVDVHLKLQAFESRIINLEISREQLIARVADLEMNLKEEKQKNIELETINTLLSS